MKTKKPLSAKSKSFFLFRRAGDAPGEQNAAMLRMPALLPL